MTQLGIEAAKYSVLVAVVITEELTSIGHLARMNQEGIPKRITDV